MTGYIFNFKQHGAFSPGGKVADAMPQVEIDAHNRKLALAEIEAMKQTGRAVLYLFPFDSLLSTGTKTKCYRVGTWASSENERLQVIWSKRGRNNFGAQRLDVWFNFDGSRWHGVNIGDNGIVRCKRTKGTR